jgi:uracil-DNA glycosylase
MISSGHLSSPIWIIGEAPGPDEIAKGEPFCGYSGFELTKMLNEAGINRNNCFMSNVADHLEKEYKYKATKAKELGITKLDGRYPTPNAEKGREHIRRLIEEHHPNLVIALGDLALWAITGEQGITKYRGSIMKGCHNVKVIPTFNPAGVTRNWQWRWLSVQDFRRAKGQGGFPDIRKPKWNFVIRPSLQTVIEFIHALDAQTVVIDIEPKKYQISCVGIATSKLDALCIPFMLPGENVNYWSKEDEYHITLALKKALINKSVKSVFHNGLFDIQYFIKQWGYSPNIEADTMLMQHAAYSGLLKRLWFVSSLYCDYYKYWKEEGRKWNKAGMDEYWIYNLQDCVYTYECWEELTIILGKLDLVEQYEFLMELFNPVLKMMLRGTRVNTTYKNRLKGELLREVMVRTTWMEEILGHPFNPDSTSRNGDMQKLFYDDFQVKPVFNRKTKSRTLDDKALKIVKQRQPLLSPLIEVIEEYKSLRVFKSLYAEARLDEDDRIRSSFNISGTETYRFSSSKNVFGTGANLENISAGREDE